jgi:lipopolysaccharide assembly outer membrane protein LptD (OstA)
MGYYKFLFALMCFSLLVHCTFAQEPKQIEIINSNTLEYDENIIQGAKRLIGNVQFKHENVLMFCDSAYYYDSNKIDAFGNVKIKQGDTLSLTGDLLNYDGNTKKAVIRNNIVMQDPTIKLTTQILNYDLNTGIANYNGNGKIINKESTLTSKYGYYYSRKKNLYFRQDVKLVTKDYTIYCDTLKHNTSTEISYFEGPTNIVSKENTIYCQNGWYNNKTDKAQFNKHAILKSKKQVNGVPAILCYKRGNKTIIPDNIVVGADENQINLFFKQCLSYVQ